MKRIIFILTALLTSLTMTAAPALRKALTVTQPDGTSLVIEQHGDEYHHWTATSDGTMVVNTGHGYYLARINEEGMLEATDMLAHETALRNSQERTMVAKQMERHSLFHERGGQRAAKRRTMSIDDIGYLPHAGNVRVLTILAAFQDLDFTVNDPVKAFDQYLNGDIQEALGNKNEKNVASVRKYFSTSSHDKFNPQFDVVGPVILPETIGFYGGASSTGGDDQFYAFCYDAVEKVRESRLVEDWSVYDNDGDGTIELVCVIFAGYGQNQGGDNNTLWAKASKLRMESGEHTINFFNCSCEKFHPMEAYKNDINGTGVFVHEMSHCMGLPDLFQTSSTVVDNQDMETWDVMDYGCYNNNGYAPALYTAWEQEVMGWTAIEPVTDASQITKLLPLEEDGKAYKIVNSENELDYIVMENIQQRGLSIGAYGHGLLVYHINYPHTAVNMNDFPNAVPNMPAVAVVPAGGSLIANQREGVDRNVWRESMAAATFPGTKGVTILSDDMGLPNYCFYSGDTKQPVGLMLSGITENTETGAISIARDTAVHSVIGDAILTPLSSPVWFNLQGMRIDQPTTKGVYIVNGKKYLKK